MNRGPNYPLGTTQHLENAVSFFFFFFFKMKKFSSMQWKAHNGNIYQSVNRTI